MECNRGEACRAKEIAEKKFTAKDLMGAKKFAMKAQSLYPGLDGIQQMLATLNVYISAENRVNGQADWYGILDVNPDATEDTIRKQYRKLALMLHPDKNKSVGADGAFKLISEAWRLLSDKAKKLEYDRKRNDLKVPSASRGPSAPPPSNGFYNSTNSKRPNMKVQNRKTTKAGSSPAAANKRPPAPPPSNGFYNSTTSEAPNMKFHNTKTTKARASPAASNSRPPAPPPSNDFYNSTKSEAPNTKVHYNKTTKAGASLAPASSRKQNLSTFWTLCCRCMMQHEYVRMFLNKNLICFNCNLPYFAFEIPAPSFGGSEASNRCNHSQQQQDLSHQEASNNVSTTGRNNSTISNAGLGGFGSSDVSGPTNVQCDRFSTTAFASSGPQSENVVPQASGTVKGEQMERQATKEVLQKRMQSSMETCGVSLSGCSGAVKRRKGMENHDTMNEKANEELKEKDHVMANGVRQDGCNNGKPLDINKESHANMSSPGGSGGNVDMEPVKQRSIDVPDPDFHDFNKDRTESCFGDNQVWAAYDDNDSMPRYYAMIHSVMSLNPLKMWISWLNLKDDSEVGSFNWTRSGFSKTCGDFRMGKNEISNTLNSFSHKVRWTKGSQGVIQIFPMKGDVWALYRNWSPEWNELTADEIIHKYDMVEVLEDYDEEQGVTVAPLVKVAGFRTVFCRHFNSREIRMIPREEMFRFSHHVPSRLLTGQEASNAPKGCHELDPAATPLDLLEVITDVEEKDIVQHEQRAEIGKMVDGVVKCNHEMEENCSGSRQGISGNVRDTEEI
ncbi:uncharacterized protein LOC127810218 [Diospyros lotus]|uniref:uncharacterized protein LOC127810218 n=1 Tax=Diospyros lotus TaxID=55363 RepID=UPI002253FB40|nr:uncharacterized protein LOC127810218 [Diospyros lotus]